MAIMDSGEARLVIAEQNQEMLRRRQPVIAAVAQQAAAFASGLEPFLDKAHTRRSPWQRYTGAYGEARCRPAPPLKELTERLAHWFRSEADPSATFGPLTGRTVIGLLGGGIWVGEAYTGSYDFGLEVADQVLRELHTYLLEAPQRIRRLGQQDALTQPEEQHSPRGREINLDRIHLDFFAADLAERIAAGTQLDAALVANTADAAAFRDWADATGRLLAVLRVNASLAGPAVSANGGFHTLTFQPLLGHAVVPDPARLCRAHLSLGLGYLIELKDLIPEYQQCVAPSEKGPDMSVNISGGNFFGAQIASQIQNIRSTIAGIKQDGNNDLADAITALEHAVTAQGSLSDKDREDLLGNIDFLAQAARTAPDNRNRGVIKAVLRALTAAAQTGTELATALATWETVLHTLT